MLWWLWILQCVNFHTILSFRHKYMFPYTLQMRRGSSYPVNYNKRVFSFCGTFHFFDIFQRIMFIWLMKSYSNVNFFSMFSMFFYVFLCLMSRKLQNGISVKTLSKVSGMSVIQAILSTNFKTSHLKVLTRLFDVCMKKSSFCNF